MADQAYPEIISRKEARKRGLKRYFTGNPCKHGHIAERRVHNTECIACIKEYSRRPEIIQRRHDRFQERHYNDPIFRENNRVRALKWRTTENGRNKSRRTVARYHATAKGRKAKARHRARPEIKEKISMYNSEYAKQYRVTEVGKAKRCANETRRRARKLGNGGDLSIDDIQYLKKTQKTCYLCHKRFTKNNSATLDHITPVSKGGTSNINNILLAHRACNSSKGKTIILLL